MLSDLAVLLKDVDWYFLGIHLCVPQHKLSAIKQDITFRGRELVEVLSYWLSNEEVSWEKIIMALEKIGGHASIISIIESKYYVTTGIIFNACDIQ